MLDEGKDESIEWTFLWNATLESNKPVDFLANCICFSTGVEPESSTGMPSWSVSTGGVSSPQN
jgi:hypothetical protein